MHGLIYSLIRMRCIAWTRNVLRASGNWKRGDFKLIFFRSLCIVVISHSLFDNRSLCSSPENRKKKMTPYFTSHDIVILLFKTPKQTYRVHLLQNLKVKFGCPLLTTLIYLSMESKFCK